MFDNLEFFCDGKFLRKGDVFHKGYRRQVCGKLLIRSFRVYISGYKRTAPFINNTLSRFPASQKLSSPSITARRSDPVRRASQVLSLHVVKHDIQRTFQCAISHIPLDSLLWYITWHVLLLQYLMNPGQRPGLWHPLSNSEFDVSVSNSLDTCRLPKGGLLLSTSSFLFHVLLPLVL